MKNLKEINDELDLIKNKIDGFNTDERKEIKKNNKLIDEYILKLDEVKDIVKTKIKSKYLKLIPKENKDLISEEKINDAYEKVKCLSNNNYLFKMEIDKILYEIRYGNNLDKINDSINKLLDKFLLVGIELKRDDFKYSISLYKYMSDFLELKNEDDFRVKIKDTFDSLYWECSNLVNHIYLVFMILLDKYHDQFENYIKHQYSDSISYEEELSNFNNLIKEYDESTMADKYLNYINFASGKLRIEDYLDDSVNKKDIITKFMDYDKYINSSLEERKYMYSQIKGLYDEMCEYMFIDKYHYIIDKVKEIYENKGNYTNNYNELMKTLKSLNKQKDKLNSKLFMIYNKINDKSSKRIIKKYNNLFNKVNNKINEIISNYENYDEVILVNDIIKKINDDSTYYDVFKIFEDNYSYLVNLMKDKNGDYEEYQKFLYNPYLSISKSIPFISEIDILNKLSSKCELFSININLSDMNKLKEELEYIIRIGYLDIYNINLNEFKLILDIKKMLGEEDI